MKDRVHQCCCSDSNRLAYGVVGDVKGHVIPVLSSPHTLSIINSSHVCGETAIKLKTVKDVFTHLYLGSTFKAHVFISTRLDSSPCKYFMFNVYKSAQFQDLITVGHNALRISVKATQKRMK